MTQSTTSVLFALEFGGHDVRAPSVTLNPATGASKERTPSPRRLDRVDRVWTAARAPAERLAVREVRRAGHDGGGMVAVRLRGQLRDGLARASEHVLLLPHRLELAGGAAAVAIRGVPVIALFAAFDDFVAADGRLHRYTKLEQPFRARALAVDDEVDRNVGVDRKRDRLGAVPLHGVRARDIPRSGSVRISSVAPQGGWCRTTRRRSRWRSRQSAR